MCSICLSIFCEPPEGALCGTCGTKLRLLDYGRKPVVVVVGGGGVGRPKKKRKRMDGEGSGVATPVGKGV